MASKVQEYTIGHTGGVLGSDYVTLSQNQTSPQRPTAVISFEVPRKYEGINYVGRRDATRFVPRTMETLTGSANDDTVVSLEADIQPIAGETDMADQDYPVCVAFNVTQNTEVDISDVDYATNEVTLATDPADRDEVKLYPIISEGTVQYQGRNQFDQVEGPVYNWPTPMYRFHDFKQLQAGREVNLHGSVDWTRYERVELLVDSPRQVVWEDNDYPRGEYVSTLQQDVEIEI